MDKSFFDIFTAINTGSLIVGFIYIGRKLQILDDLKITTDKIKANLKVVTDFLTRDSKIFNPSELAPYSPLQLTSEGEDFIKKIGFNEAFETHKKDFFKCIDAEDPKLKYDVKAAAIRSISLLADKEYMNFLKVFLYNNPTRSMEDTAPTLGVYLRDKYLAEHPEIIE